MIQLTGGFRLPVPPEQAFRYFTPLGEKEWAPGWDPRFPADNAGDETVFETSHGHHDTTWVVVDNVPGQRIRYARVAHGVSAGTVDVTLTESPGGASEITVTYALSALAESGREHLARFADGYEDYMRSWQVAIARQCVIVARSDENGTNHIH